MQLSGGQRKMDRFNIINATFHGFCTKKKPKKKQKYVKETQCLIHDITKSVKNSALPHRAFVL